MQWFRHWLSKGSERPAKVSSASSTNGFRPQVESLDERVVPTVSTAITTGGTFTLAVNTSNVLVALDASGNQSTTSFTNVRTAQAFRDANGNLGADIVFRDGSWTHFDASAGGPITFSASMVKSMFGGLILDAGSAYDSKGVLSLDIVVDASTKVDTNGNTFSDAVGSLKTLVGGSFVDTGLGSNVRWVSVYEATDGSTGTALGQVIPAGDATTTFDDNLLVRKADAVTGLTTLYNGSQFAAGAIVEYSQSTSPSSPTSLLSPTPATRAAVIDVTFEGQPTFAMTAPFGLTADNGYALQFTTGASGTTGGLLGSAGISTSPNVVGIISSDGTIKTGAEYPGEMFGGT